MGLGNFTKAGMRRLGELLSEAMEYEGLSRPALVSLLLERVGHQTNTSKIQRMEGGFNNEPPAGFVWAIAQVGLIKAPNGEPYTLEELLAIACEYPLESLREKENGFKFADFLQQHLESIGEEVPEFAHRCQISAVEMQQILDGKKPTWLQLVQISQEIPDKSFEDLAKLLNFDPSAEVGSIS